MIAAASGLADGREVIAGDDNGLRARDHGRELVRRPRQAVVGARDDQRRHADRPDVAGCTGGGGTLYRAERREVVRVLLREAPERAIDRSFPACRAAGLEHGCGAGSGFGAAAARQAAADPAQDERSRARLVHDEPRRHDRTHRVPDHVDRAHREQVEQRLRVPHHRVVLVRVDIVRLVGCAVPARRMR